MMQSDSPYTIDQLSNMRPFSCIFQPLSLPRRGVLFGDNLNSLSRLGYRGNQEYKQIGVLLYRRSRATRAGSIRLWDAATGALLQTLEGHSDLVSSVAFSPEGNLVVSVTNKAVRLGDAATGALLHTLDGHSSWVRSVALFPHDKLLPTLHVSNHWLAEGTTSFLWLPTDYRPICKAVRDRVVIFGHSAGRISLLQIGKGSKCIVSN